MKVLSIGNSFSQDAHKWLHKLAELNGVEMETLNLCNSGCDLSRHYKHIQENLPNYAAEPNGGKSTGNTTMEDALKLTDWDVVTIQQVSGKSGGLLHSLTQSLNVSGKCGIVKTLVNRVKVPYFVHLYLLLPDKFEAIVL